MDDNGEVRTVSETGGEKGVKLERFDLIPVCPLQVLARRYGVGARKYDERNWERGYEWSKSYGALQRHLNAFWSGEDDDEGEPNGHLAAAAFHIFALLEFVNTHPEFDDRPKAAANVPPFSPLSIWKDGKPPFSPLAIWEDSKVSLQWRPNEVSVDVKQNSSTDVPVGDLRFDSSERR